MAATAWVNRRQARTRPSTRWTPAIDLLGLDVPRVWVDRAATPTPVALASPRSVGDSDCLWRHAHFTVNDFVRLALELLPA
jgi:hypothetical protein